MLVATFRGETVLLSVLAAVCSCSVASPAVTEEELVASLLKPVVETIVQAGSRAYLSPVAIDNALCFLSSFLEDLRSKENLLGTPPNHVALETLKTYMEPRLGEVLKSLLGWLYSGGLVSEAGVTYFMTSEWLGSVMMSYCCHHTSWNGMDRCQGFRCCGPIQGSLQ